MEPINKILINLLSLNLLLDVVYNVIKVRLFFYVLASLEA